MCLSETNFLPENPKHVFWLHNTEAVKSINYNIRQQPNLLSVELQALTNVLTHIWNIVQKHSGKKRVCSIS